MISPLPILVADDEESDRLLMKIAMRKSGLPHPLIFVKDGHETIAYLSGQRPYTDRHAYPCPGLVLLDLKMPGLNGFEVLAWLTTQPELKHLPVVVLTSSTLESDMEKARQLGACDYLVKHSNFHEVGKALAELIPTVLAPSAAATALVEA